MICWDKNLVIFDVETTPNAARNHHHIIEIGAVKVSTTLEVVDTFHSLVKPPVAIDEFNEKLTGINDGMVEKSYPWSVVGLEFARFCGYKASRLAAFGTFFDIPVLRDEYAECNIEFPLNGSALCIKSIAMFWMQWMGYKSKFWNLQSIAEKLEITPTGSHRAYADAWTTYNVLKYISEQMK